jgi:5-methylcytosine-specific restriction endonuclease McrA
VLRRDNFSCQACGASPAKTPGVILHVDHIRPWSEGGETVFENLHTLCEPCNIGRSNLPLTIPTATTQGPGAEDEPISEARRQ